MVADLMQMLKNTNWLNGKIRLIDSPSDSELATLYEDCMFTVYPSFYEGWGLPVSESHAYGAPCISSNRTSLPEAGGDLALYFDPDHLAEAVRLVRQVIEDPAGLQAWRERVAREFKHVAWVDAAQAIITELQRAAVPEHLPAALAAQ
jgi:glycosyltransferase involved in cell wall biosynthesis